MRDIIHDELAKNRIFGDTKEIYNMREWNPDEWEEEYNPPARRPTKEWFNQHIVDIGEGWWSNEKKSVTGGMSSHLATSMYFARNRGLVLILDTHEIPVKSKVIQYEKEFFNENPEAYCVVTGQDGVAMYDGEIVMPLRKGWNTSTVTAQREVIPSGSMNYKGFSENTYKEDWLPLEPYRHSHEDEVYAYTDNILLDEVIQGITQFITKDQIKKNVKESDLEKVGANRNTDDLERLMMAWWMTLKDDMLDRVPERKSASRRLDRWWEMMAVVLIDDSHQLSKDDQFDKLPPERFIMAYDGIDITREYDEAEPYIGLSEDDLP